MIEQRSDIKGPSSKRGWIHFGVASVLLASFTVVWYTKIEEIVGVTDKEPVPWPDVTEVTPDFMLENFPYTFGPQDRWQLLDTGEYKDGLPLGIHRIDEDTLDALKIGTPQDQSRRPERRSNWYMVRTYQDTQEKNPASPYSLWRLEIYYYTGGRDIVPHVPEICGDAAGATILEPEVLTWDILAARQPWDTAVPIRRVPAETPTRLSLKDIRTVTYYVFSVNGQPMDDRFAVRVRLRNPWEPHAYFAKIQFSPVGGLPSGHIEDQAEADRRANEFAQYALPIAISRLPSAEKVDALNAKSKQDESETANETTE